MADGTYRFHGAAPPLAAAALVSCGVLTGWGAAVRTAGTGPGDTAIIAADPVPAKRDLARSLGATHAAAGLAEAPGWPRRRTRCRAGPTGRSCARAR